MLSLYRAWLGPSPCVARPAPPPGAHRPVPRRARAPSPRMTPPPPSPSSSASSELDVENVEIDVEAENPEPPKRSGAVLDIASCDGPVQFTRVLNEAWREPPPERWRSRRAPRPPMHYYPCKSCGCKFPSYYFVHKHRKRCHADEPTAPLAQHHNPEPSASTSSAYSNPTRT